MHQQRDTSLRSWRALLGGLIALIHLIITQHALAEEVCRSSQVEGARYTICTIDLREHQIRLFWRGADAAVIGSIDRLPGVPEGAQLVFAVNAGMYYEGRSPVGLYVENGPSLKRANPASGLCNFPLGPTGVFFF